MRSAQKWGLALVIAAFASPASAQIISTSIPKGLAGKSDKKWAFHVMASPFAKWSINLFEEDETSFNAASAKPNSILFAGEVFYQVSDNVSIGGGGWFNSVGSVSYDYEALDIADSLYFLGTADVKTTMSEFHGSVFYKDFGVQVGVVSNNQEFEGVNLTNVQSPIGVSLNATQTRLISDLTSASLRGEEFNSTDTTAYLVYKKSGSGDRPWNVSLGLGAYESDDTVFSGFVAGSVTAYKGLSVDASFWYIGAPKSELRDELEVSESLSRFTIGLGYTF